jgi:hypothetical protein
MPPSAPAESAAPAAPPPPAAEEIITAPGGVPAAPVEMPASSPAVQQPDPASNGFNFMDEQEVGEQSKKKKPVYITVVFTSCTQFMRK